MQTRNKSPNYWVYLHRNQCLERQSLMLNLNWSSLTSVLRKTIYAGGIWEFMGFKRKQEKMFNVRSSKFASAFYCNTKTIYLMLWMCRTNSVIIFQGTTHQEWNNLPVHFTILQESCLVRCQRCGLSEEQPPEDHWGCLLPKERERRLKLWPSVQKACE